MRAVKRINSKFSYKEGFFFSSFFSLYCICMRIWMLTYWGNHFTLYVNQTIMFYALNLYSDVC